MKYDDIKIDDNPILNMLKDYCKPKKQDIINAYIGGRLTKEQYLKQMKNIV